MVNENKQKVFILGDSIIKRIQGWEIAKKTRQQTESLHETIFWLQS